MIAKKHLTHLCNAVGMAMIKNGQKPHYPMVEDTIKALAVLIHKEDSGDKELKTYKRLLKIGMYTNA